MGASCLLAVKLGFQWHKATGELVEPTPVAKPPSVPPNIFDHRSTWAIQAVAAGAQKGAGTHHDAAFSPSDAIEENLGAAISSRPFQERWSQRRSCTAETQPAIPGAYGGTAMGSG